MEKSSLLKYILAEADKQQKENGFSSINANRFMLELLKTIKQKREDNLPKSINTFEVKREITIVDLMLCNYCINLEEAIENLSKELKSADNNTIMEEIMFTKVSYSATEYALKEKSPQIKVSHYLKFILDEPTKGIKNNFFGGIAKDDTDDTDVGISYKNILDKSIKDIMDEVFDDKEGDEEEDTTDNTMNEEEDELSKIVEKTQKIQKMLLENIFGQDHAINTFVSGYFQAELMSLIRKDTGKPQASFLFAGPPGVGKTFLAEKAAEALKRPFRRFDMSEYSDKEANIEFCGSDNVYKNSKEGNVTGFVARNPKCVLLFDEFEKAHLNILHLFLQILDAGKLRDSHTDKEVSFKDAIIIITTNVGRKLYEDSNYESSINLSKKQILKAISAEKNPITQEPLFPAAICSRFAYGNVVMFNHIKASNLLTITKREIENNIKSLEKTTDIKVNIDNLVYSAIMLSEGGKADARTIKGRANSFFYDEIYELLRLISSKKVGGNVESLNEINVNISLDGASEEIKSMFVNNKKPAVLVFADEDMSSRLKSNTNLIDYFCTDNIEEAKEIMFNNDISIVLCDIRCGMANNDSRILNVEDTISLGHDFMTYVLESGMKPVYIIQKEENEISTEEFLSLAKVGVSDIITLSEAQLDGIENQILKKCEMAYQQENMLKLAKANKVISFKTSQTTSNDYKISEILLYDFCMKLVPDIDDAKSILNNTSKPTTKFADVIGAEEAKKELQYFVEYLKNPLKYMRKGVRTPKGVLLYGPPGTGKTMLAKAMAGESNVTFIQTEGNSFLKKYVGEGAESVHSLFALARKYAPSILFIDEIDAIAKNRNSVNGDDITGNILTAFLTEMDGFNTDTLKPVFVLAATNYDIDAEKTMSLDPAMIRRFDRRIYIDLPNKDEREKYIRMKMDMHKSVKLSKEQIENIAIRSTGMSLAELELVFEMAMRNALRSENLNIDDAILEEAFETFNNGEERKWSADLLRRTACHEAGHALICWLGGEKPAYLTVVGRKGHGGYMQHDDNENKFLYTKSELLNRIRVALAGRAAEIVYYGLEDGLSTGAGGDLYSATQMAEKLICNYGMDESIGLCYIDDRAIGTQKYSLVLEKIDEILQREMKNAISLISKNKKAIDALIEELMKKNHMKQNEIDDIIKSNIAN